MRELDSAPAQEGGVSRKDIYNPEGKRFHRDFFLQGSKAVVDARIAGWFNLRLHQFSRHALNRPNRVSHLVLIRRLNRFLVGASIVLSL
jgi:hypothetical protein